MNKTKGNNKNTLPQRLCRHERIRKCQPIGGDPMGWREQLSNPRVRPCTATCARPTGRVAPVHLPPHETR